ncbi:ssk1 response regulator receiver [Mortierella alpina]|nr:ssk1 response regulator receiver [Mortierella alpina]
MDTEGLPAPQSTAPADLKASPPASNHTSNHPGHAADSAATDAKDEPASSDEPTPPSSEHGAQSAPSQPRRRKMSFRVQNRPAQLIRNLHANYFNRHQQETAPPDSPASTAARVVHSIRGNVFAFGAVMSMAGCAVLLGQRYSGYTWHGIGHSGLLAQVAYHGLFAAACSWQWLKRMALTIDAEDTDRDTVDCDGDLYSSNDNRAGSRSPVYDPAPSSEPVDASDSFATSDSSAASLWPSPHLGVIPSSRSLSCCIFGYGLLGLFGLTPALAAHGKSSLVWNPLLLLSILAPVIVAPCLWGLDAISRALSKDLERQAAETDELWDRHESLLEAYRDDNLLKKNILLETVGKEVQDAATLAIETLRQMTPSGLFPPSISREQLSPCTLPIPITSILGLFTTMRHLQYISRNMQRLSRVMFTEYVQGIVEKTSPHYHRGENSFDVGEFVQSLGDLVSADASLKGVELVIYHSEYDLNHVPIKGSEESWRHALINLIKSIIDSAKTGSTVELCLVLFTIPQPEKEKNKVMVSFEITYSPNPDSLSTEDDLAQLNALLASKLVRAMGGSLEIEQLEKRAKRFIVSVEVEMSHAQPEEKIGNLKQLDEQHQHQHQPIHPLETSKAEDAASLPAAVQDRLQRLESMQTAPPVHESQQFFQQHIKTPLVSPSPPPSSPPPRRAGSGSTTRISTEPTITDLVRFSRKLAGVRAIVISKEHSAFAVRLVGYLRAWGLNIMKRSIPENGGTPGEPVNDVFFGDETPTTGGGAKRTNSSSSLSGKYSALSGKSDSTFSTAKSLSNPAFIMIDDDVRALSQQILKLQTSPPSPAPLGGAPKRPTHRRHKSVTTIQHTSIIYFTSLPTFKQARDAIMLTLGTQTPGLSYSIASTLIGNQLAAGPLPYILVLPKPAGPRRVLTAIHTAVHAPVLDQSYSPIATAPTSPAPVLRHFSTEVNPMERDEFVFDPVTNQYFARMGPHSTQSSPGGVSPNNGVPTEQRTKRDLLRQLAEAGAPSEPVAYPFDQAPSAIVTPDTPYSLRSVGSPAGVPVQGNAQHPGGIQFDPTARPPALSPSLGGPAPRRTSSGGGRYSSQSTPNPNGDGSTVVAPPNAGPGFSQSFATMYAASQRLSETAPPPTPTANANLARLNNPLLRPGGARSPAGTPPLITRTSGLLFSPPQARHPMNSGMASPMPQRPDPVALRANSGGATGSIGSISLDVDSHKANTSAPLGTACASPLPSSPGLPNRQGSGAMSGVSHAVSSPPPAEGGEIPVARARSGAPSLGKKGKEASKTYSPSTVKSGVVERVSPLVNVLIVEDNPINQMILIKFMRQRKIKYDLACNGKEAVDKWRVGGFHLVLMDIQMPVMDGIEATREIRRLEKAQKIGVFSTDKPNSVGNSIQAGLLAASAAAAAAASASMPENILATAPGSGSSSGSAVPTSPPASPFRSPVIIVALTAEAESADSRNTALLAGCNDYITKPIDFAWLERKIVDWGCMQALIDVDAWKEWKRDLDGTSPGSPGRSGSQSTGGGSHGSGGGGGGGGGGGVSSSQVAALKKTLANAGSVTRANLKRPSISARSIKGSKAQAAAAVAAAAAAKTAEAAAAVVEKEKNGSETVAQGSSSSPTATSTSATGPVVKPDSELVEARVGVDETGKAAALATESLAAEAKLLSSVPETTTDEHVQ